MKKHLLFSFIFLQTIIVCAQISSKEKDYTITYNADNIELNFDNPVVLQAIDGKHFRGIQFITNKNENYSYTIKNTDPGSIIQLNYEVLNKENKELHTTYIATASKSTGNIEVYFNHPVDVSYSQGHDAVNLGNTLDDKLITYINACNKTMDIAIYNSYSPSSITGIAGAINSAFARGVKVRVIYDGSTSSNMIPLLNSSIPRLASPNNVNYGIMHNKFVIFDANDSDANKPIVWTGSTNWTVAQIDGPDKNSVIVIQDQSLALGYQIEFEEMWGSTTTTPNTINSKFGPYKTDNTPHTYNIGGKIVNSYFSPSDGTNSKIIDAINSANTDIDIATMLITRSDISNTLIDKYTGGLTSTQIILDIQNPTGSKKMALQQGINADQVRDDAKTSGIMHHKFMVVDNYNSASDPLVLVGSHNWSSAAEYKNDENTLIVHDINIANQYYQAFAYLYKLSGGIIKNPLSVNETRLNKNRIEVYPNPSNGLFNIKTNSKLSGSYKIIVFDSTGKIVYNQSGNDFTTQKIDLTEKPSGLYFLNIVTESGVYSIKVIKQ